MNMELIINPPSEENELFLIDMNEEAEHLPARPEQKRARRRQGAKRDRPYNWTEAEHQRYIKFLMKKKHLFALSPQERKNLKINVLISKAVHTRNSTQCHTHHQKMMVKYTTIESIIENECTTPLEAPEVKVVEDNKS